VLDRLFVTLTPSRVDRYRPIHASHCLQYVCVSLACGFFAKINYVKIHFIRRQRLLRLPRQLLLRLALRVVAVYKVTLLDFAAITADDDDSILPRGPPCYRRRSLL